MNCIGKTKKTLVYQQLTKSCNLKCIMCDFHLNKGENLDVNHFKKLINIYREYGIKGITFWGGEPFLFTGIYELIQYTKESGLKVGIITNGTILNKEKLKNVIPYIDEIIVSIDSNDKDINDYIRGKAGSYDLSVKFLDFLYENKNLNEQLVVSIDSTIQAVNYDSFHKIIELAKKYNFLINFDPVQLFGYGNSHDDKLKPNEHHITIIEKELKNLKKNFPDIIIQSQDSLEDIILYLEGKENTKKCKSFIYDIIVDPLGNVFECWGSNTEIYNILEDGIKDLTTESKPYNNCAKCGFSHVREGAYDDGYSII